MTSTLTPAIADLLLQDRELIFEVYKDRVMGLLPESLVDQAEWVEARLRQSFDIFNDYVGGESIDSLRPRMGQFSKAIVSSGVRMDEFVRIILDTSAQRKKVLVEQHACEPQELVQAFSALDIYEHSLFDEFSIAQTEYWERREKAAAKLHSDFFQDSPFPALTGGEDLMIREINPAGLKDLGIRRDQAVDMSFPDWLKSMNLDHERLEDLMELLEKDGHLLHEPIQITCPNGCDEKHLLLSTNYISDPDGNRVGFQAMIDDLTQEHELEKQLSDQMIQLNAVFNSSPVGLIFADSDRTIQRINTEACRLLGYPPPEQVLQMDMASFRETAAHSYKHPERFAKLLDEVYGDPNSSAVGVFELVLPHRLVSYTVSPVHADLGPPIGWFWIFTDVTERIAREQLRSELSHMLVHDLKNPLTAIQGGIHVLRKLFAEDGKTATVALDVIDRNADRLLRLVMNLLDVERLEQGKLQLQREKIDLPDLLSSVAEAQKPAAGERELGLDVDPHLAAAAVMADATLLERVVTNLVSNAIKHTRGNGHITIEASGDPRGYYRISVIDNGEGIPAEYHEKIFERFGQAELRKGGRRVDTGLGLTFCKLAVEAHGGKIYVESEPGKGSTFSVRLPGLILGEDSA